ncbi:MAG: zf-HC2 domain-containing protein [Verrucomicrobiales bacterium]|nr:zf-HC2 domain-containing protein [Verrucomicrobiales bacterium]
MKHPDTQEWMGWLYGEAAPAAKLDLEAHLAVCPECRERVERWRSTMDHLDAAAAPRLEAVRRPRSWPWLKVSAAAAVLLISGGLVGRMSSGSEEALDRRFHEWTTSWQARADAQRKQDLEEMAARTAVSVQVATQEIVADLSRRIQAMRQEDQLALIEIIERVDRQRAGEIGELREGLSVLASQTGDGLERAQNQMRLLAGTLEGSFPNTNPKTQEVP